MKYKVGDKFLMEIEVGRIEEGSQMPYKMLPYGDGWSEGALDEIRRVDDMTAEEAWEIARTILHMYFEGKDKELIGYGSSYDLIAGLTLQQAKAKIKAWEAEKEIKVGDEVVHKSNNNDSCKFFVTDKEEDVISGFSGYTGEVFSGRNINNYVKTGRHIDIQGLLEQIGGAE